MGLEEPTSGIVQGVGRVAAVFQEDRLCPQLTAVQNVTLVLPGSAEQYKEQIIKDFQQLGMDAAALALPAARLSGGQKRHSHAEGGGGNDDSYLIAHEGILIVYLLIGIHLAIIGPVSYTHLTGPVSNGNRPFLFSLLR